jgi:ABC-type uncharacterized transport system fused permease/ATPase subunit
MIVFPVVLLLIMGWRNKKSVEILFERNNQQIDIVDGVVETTKDFRLIADYDCKGECVDRFEKEIKEYNLSDIAALQLLTNNSYLTPWITTIFVAVYTYTGGCDVIEGDLALAMYLTNIAVFNQMGAAYGQLLNMCVQVQTAFPALLRITRLLNLKSDDQIRMEWTRFQAETTQKMARTFPSEGDTNPIDSVSLWVKDLSFCHYHIPDRDDLPLSPNDISPVITLRGSIELQQGSLVSLFGPGAGGKSTLLRAFGGVLIPQITASDTSGQVFVPCHLRVIHIPSEFFFMRGSLLDNLVYGVRKGDTDGDKTRVKIILQHLGLPSNVMYLLEEDSIHKDSWIDVLCESQKHLLSIARAIIANPQVICVHKPTDKFSQIQGRSVLQVLQMFVHEKGVGQDQSLQSRTRPRTCIMTNVNIAAKDFADVFVFVTREGMKFIDRESVREDMMKT